MAIAIFNEGTQRYHDPDSGRMVKTPQDNESQSLGSNLGASSIVSALRSEFKGLNAHLAFRFDSVIAAMQGTDAEKRDALISGENTDPVSGGVDKDPPGDKKSFMDTLKGLNPFQDGIGTKMTILLLTGALFAISQFGDKLIKPLASFLEWADGDPTESIGEYSEKFKKWWATKWAGVKLFWADIKLKFEDMKEEYEKLKVWWEPKWASVKSFLKLFKDMFTGIDEWVKSYDKDDSGVLETDEIDTLVSDVFKTIKDKIWSLTGGIVDGLIAAIGLYTVGKLALTALFKNDIGTGLFAGARLAPLAGAAGLGLVGVASLAAVVAYGIWTLADNAMTAYQDAITDEAGNKQNFSVKEFVSRLLGGDNPEGGWLNAMTNAWDKAVIGGAAGAVAGTIVPGLGTVVGGAAGFLIGGVLGAVTGKAGADKINLWVTGIESDVMLAIDTIGGFFSNLINGFKSLGDGDKSTTFKDAFNQSKFTNQPLVDRQLKSMNTTRDELAASNAAIESGEETPLFGESFLFSSTSPLGQYLNSISLFGKRLSQDVDGAALEALDVEILEFETANIQEQQKLKNKLLEEGVNAKYYREGDVPKMSILQTDSHDTKLETFVGSSLTPDNNSTGARLLSGGAYSTLGLDFLKNQ